MGAVDKQKLQVDGSHGNPGKERGRPSATGVLVRRVCFPFILAGVVTCLCAAQASQGNPLASSTSTQGTREGIGNLVCTISLQQTEWQQPQVVEVGLVIENRLDSELSVSVVPSLTLKPIAATEESQKSEAGYLALWDLGKGKTLPASATSPLQLKPGDSKRVSSDIASLLWSGINASVPPQSKLFQVVPPGRYTLRLELIGRHGMPLCSSNAVNVLIK
jgi:hypothetical protein